MQQRTLIALSLASFFAHNAHAEATDSAKSVETERIVVTGSRIVESIDEVPASITVINREQIEKQLRISSDLQGLLAALVPGMAPNTGTSSNSTQTLRGRPPLVMIDGIPQSTPLRNGSLDIKTIDINAIERIEVIKGATSVYGNGAAGGVINYITKQSQEQGFGGRVSVANRFSGVKTDETLGGRVNATLHAKVDEWSYVLSATLEQNGLQRDADGDVLGTIYGLSDTKTEGLFAKVGYDFDSDKNLLLSYNFYSAQQQTDHVDITGSVNSGFKTYAVRALAGQEPIGEPQGPDGNKNWLVKYHDNQLFSNTALTIDAYQQTLNNVFFFSAELSNPSEGYSGGQSIIASDKEGVRATANSQFDWDNVAATFIYGIDWLRDVTSQPLVDGRIWVPEMDMQNQAGFVQSKWLLAEHWVFKAGIRKDNIELVVDDYRTLKLCRTPTQCSIPINVKGDTLTYSATTYNLGLKFNALSEFSPFVSFSQGADISDLGRLLRTANVNDIAKIRTEASIINNYEIGFSSEWQGLFTEFALYRSTSELGTSQSFDKVTGVYMPVRSPQRMWGYELQFNYAINREWQIAANYAFVEGKDTSNNSYLGANQISPPQAQVQLAWLPSNAIKVNLNAQHVGSRKRFMALNGTYVGDQGPISAYNTMNASVSYQWNDWSGSLGIENLLNANYFPARAQAYTYPGYNSKAPGQTFTVSVQYDL